MKRNSKRSNAMPLLASVLMIFMLFGACLKSNNNDILPEKEEIVITLSLKLPTVSRGLKTYALSDDEETKLKDIDVLVFTDDGTGTKFSYRTVGKIINQSSAGNGGGNVDIEVKMWRTQIDSRLVVIANARTQLNAYPFVAGELLEVFQENLVYQLEAGERWLANLDGATDNYIPLPMWAEHTVTGGINDDTIILPGSINLLRSVVRVDVMADAVASDFTLDWIHVYNSNRNGLIIPGSDPTTPSLPSDLLTNENNILHYDVTFGNKLEGAIYLFEAAAGIGDGDPADPYATALVIEGHYNANPSTTYFYRIDFKDASNNLVPLLRNHRYVINITGATEMGTALEDRDNAFAAPSLNQFWYDRSQGIKPVQSRGYSHQSPSTIYLDIVPEDRGCVIYTITTVNENE